MSSQSIEGIISNIVAPFIYKESKDSPFQLELSINHCRYIINKKYNNIYYISKCELNNIKMFETNNINYILKYLLNISKDKIIQHIRNTSNIFEFRIYYEIYNLDTEIYYTTKKYNLSTMYNISKDISNFLNDWDFIFNCK